MQKIGKLGDATEQPTKRIVIEKATLTAAELVEPGTGRWPVPHLRPGGLFGRDFLLLGSLGLGATSASWRRRSRRRRRSAFSSACSSAEKSTSSR